MNIKCDFCGSMIDERSQSCPHCGAPLSGVNRTASGQPQTIEELKAWYESHNLPPEEITRFFIGKDISEPKAFGIYKTETGDFVVYKNKSTGERAVRYKGADEGYAVNELYQRLKAEIADQKHNSPGAKPTALKDDSFKKRNRRLGCGCVTLLVIMMIYFIASAAFDGVPPRGYYKYNGTEYYHQNSKWFSYDPTTDKWLEAESLSEYINDDNADQYKYSGHEGTAFEQTNWYDNGSSGSSDDDDDWDSDSKWSSSDSWSSSSTDWDSDW